MTYPADSISAYPTRPIVKQSARKRRSAWVAIMTYLIPSSMGLLACDRSKEQVDKKAPEVREPLKPVYRVHSGGGAVDKFGADQYHSGGDKYSTGSTVSTTGVKNAGPPALYQTERFGNHTYTFPGLTPDKPYTVRLHFAEIFFNAAGSRRFNVIVNGVPALTNLDIFAAVGAHKALVRDVPTKASSAGQVVVQFVSVKGDAKSNGIEIFSSVDGVNQVPLVNVPATASPNPSTELTTVLSALGSDDSGEAGLTYTWAATGTPPGTVTFSANGSNAAKKVTATFSKAGTYALEVAMKDKGGESATSRLSVVVGAVPLSPVVQVDCGGKATGTFRADEAFSGGNVHATSTTIQTDGVFNAAPAAVYQSQRYGNFSYTFGSLTAGGPYTVRLHFAETFWTASGSRVFNVLINGAPTLTNFDVFGAGGANKAVVRDVATTANEDGKIVVQYVTVVDNAQASGIEVLSASASPPAASGAAPPPVASGATSK